MFGVADRSTMKRPHPVLDLYQGKHRSQYRQPSITGRKIGFLDEWQLYKTLDDLQALLDMEPLVHLQHGGHAFVLNPFENMVL